MIVRINKKVPSVKRKISDDGEKILKLIHSCVIIMASDNGVVEEGVASAPQSVTLSQTAYFTRGLTGVAVLAKQFNSDLMVIDVGINSDVQLAGVINKKIRKGTNNIAKEAAMTRKEALQAIAAGIEAAEEAKNKGYEIIGVGEMGITHACTMPI